jgi:hypothetical protein
MPDYPTHCWVVLSGCTDGLQNFDKGWSGLVLLEIDAVALCICATQPAGLVAGDCCSIMTVGMDLSEWGRRKSLPHRQEYMSV